MISHGTPLSRSVDERVDRSVHAGMSLAFPSLWKMPVIVLILTKNLKML